MLLPGFVFSFINKCISEIIALRFSLQMRHRPF